MTMKRPTKEEARRLRNRCPTCGARAGVWCHVHSGPRFKTAKLHRYRGDRP